MIKKLFFSVIFSVLFSLPSHAALFTYSGVIDECFNPCTIYSAVGEGFEASFEAPGGAGLVDFNQIFDANMAILTPSGGSLGFNSGVGLASSLLVDDFNNVISGSVTINATDGPNITSATLDHSTNRWVMSILVNGINGTLHPIASGSGVFTSNEPSPVPLPAAAWFFASALGGLLVLRKSKDGLQ